MLHSLGLKTLNSSCLPYVLRVERMLGRPSPKQGSARILVLVTGPFSRTDKWFWDQAPMPGKSKSKYLYVLWLPMILRTKFIVLMLVVQMTIFPPFMSMVFARIPRSSGTVSSSRRAVRSMVCMLSILSWVTSPRSSLKMGTLNTRFCGVC